VPKKIYGRRTDLDRFDGTSQERFRSQTKLNLKLSKAAAMIRRRLGEGMLKRRRCRLCPQVSCATGQGDKVCLQEKESPRAAGRLRFWPSARKEQGRSARRHLKTGKLSETVQQAASSTQETRGKRSRKAERDRRYAARRNRGGQSGWNLKRKCRSRMKMLVNFWFFRGGPFLLGRCPRGSHR